MNLEFPRMSHLVGEQEGEGVSIFSAATVCLAECKGFLCVC